MSDHISYSMLQSMIGGNAERMAFIDFKLYFTGLIKRSDLHDEYGLSEASATRLISEYLDLRETNLIYDKTKKVYTIDLENYRPLIDLSIDAALAMLAYGFNKNKIMGKPVLPFSKIGEIPLSISLNDVSTITRAIANREVVRCRYISNNSDNHSYRNLVPLAILHDGKNWIFRAYDRNETRSDKFKNFNFSRVAEVSHEAGDSQQNYESLQQDKKWNTSVPLVLELHPSLTIDEKKTIKQDFGMKPDQNELILTEKAAFLWILTKQWSIDTSDSECNENTIFYKFLLRNTDMLAPYL